MTNMEFKNFEFWNEYIKLLCEVDSKRKNIYAKPKKGKEYQAFCRKIRTTMFYPFNDIKNPLYSSHDSLIINEYGKYESSGNFLERHKNFKNDVDNSLTIEATTIYDYEV